MRKSLETRFWGRVNKTDGPVRRQELGRCWPWTGSCNVGRDNRAHIKISGRNYYVHRVAFYLYYGHWPQPHGLHKCDFQTCCNPMHIFEGNQLENIADMVAKGRARGAKGNANSRKLSDAEIQNIKKLLVTRSYTQRHISEMYDVSQATVSHINTKTCWKGLLK